mgnify:CR=1 FL=1
MSEYYDVEKIKYDKRSKLWLVKFVGYDELHYLERRGVSDPTK